MHKQKGTPNIGERWDPASCAWAVDETYKYALPHTRYPAEFWSF